MRLEARDRWTEVNIGPFYVATDSDSAAARTALNQLEQLRWVLGNLLESKDLPSLWPIRIMLTGKNEGTNPREFVWKNAQYLLVLPTGSRLPLDSVAGLLLDANTPRLPSAVESGLRQLFSTLDAHGSRVNWGSAPPHPDLDWARMQLFATKFEYGTSFHIFLTALKGGSTLAAAERNAFAKPAAELEAEAKANLAAGSWSAVPVSGRPLDIKRDFGEHSLDSATAAVYLADWALPAGKKEAEAAFKSAVEAGEAAAALGYEGLAEIAQLDKEDPKPFWDDAIRARSRSAPVYLAAAEGLPAVEALPLLKRAAQLNERWAEPVYRQAQLAASPAERAALLKTALKLNPRAANVWVELAQLQTVSGEATAAQGSWLRAEDAAPSDAERNRIHELRLSSEQERLDAADAARRSERDAAHLADQQALQAETDRIRAAEQKANQSVPAASDEAAKTADAVPWNSLVKQRKLNGLLVRVDCLKAGWRLSVKASSGATTQLLLPKTTDTELPCGLQSKPRRVSLEYRAVADDELHTSGEVTSLQLQ